MTFSLKFFISVLPNVFCIFSCTQAIGGEQINGALTASIPVSHTWWFWVGTLFAASLAIGIISVWSGIEAGFLFVPMISYLFPFYFDFVRACGLMVGLAGALVATPGFLKENLTNLRLAISIFLAMSIGSIIGAVLVIRLPEDVLYKGLGVTILGACALLVVGKTRERPDINKSDPLTHMLRVYGAFRDSDSGEIVPWRAHRLPIAMCVFLGMGIVAGMFGLSTFFANISVLNLLMGIPLKVSIATGRYLVSATHASALWVFLNQGAILPILMVPSLVGTMLGSLLGLKTLGHINNTVVRWLVIIVLIFLGVSFIFKP